MKRRSRLVELCGALPLVGRHVVKPAYLWGYDAAIRGETSRKAASILALGAFALIHAPNAAYGAQEMVAHFSASQNLPGAYDGLYAAVNGLIAYTSLYLGAKVASTPREPAPLDTSAEPRITNHADAYNPPNLLHNLLRRQVAVDLAVTAVGQLAFAATAGIIK